MKLELFEKYIQISIQRDSEFLKRAISFATRHFSQSYRLSSSILILDDGERLKKDYFLNWAYHIGLQKESRQKSVPFERLLENSELPIRIKIMDEASVLEYVQVAMRFIQPERIALCLNRPSRLARRYLISAFEEYIVSYGKQELYLDSTRTQFWEKLMGILSQKVIHNVVLDFDYDSFKAHNRFEGFESWDYMTKEERLIRQSLKVLSCKVNDDWSTIKNRYLELAREFHPDNVYGQDSSIVQGYTERFRSIQEAYERLKVSLRQIA
ncbi:J domain-containing protein [Wolinella succinogenes]|jgi:hypothetical protein|nr:J domain-containing protein [Wolinella succinogenes]VEG80804.1 Dna-J like membrane chaperone protein [Wolinella succinogenes]HCZ18668.1 J domain-containing protein [Helicobacter sp.]